VSAADPRVRLESFLQSRLLARMAAGARVTAALLLALTLSQLHAAAALNILFIGNSITYYNSGLDVVRTHVQAARGWHASICGVAAAVAQASATSTGEHQISCGSATSAGCA